MLAVTVHASTPSEYKIIVHSSQEKELAQLIREAMPSSVLIDNIAYTSDVILTEAEFFYLVDIPRQSVVTKDQIIQAIFYLLRKNKFETITVSLQSAVSGHTLHFDLVSYWTLGKIKLHGFMLGKERYRYLYAIESGEQFDQQKHNYSLEQMYAAFKQEGYYNISIDDRLSYDDAIKEVTVHLTFKRGKIFKIRDVEVHMNHELQEKNGALEREVCTRLQRLHGIHYQRQQLNEAVSHVKYFLLEEGYLQSTIELEERFDKERSKVDLSFFIDLGPRKEFIFTGNSHFSKRQLLDHLLLFGRSALMLPTDLLREEIITLYQNNGFKQVAVDVHEEEDKLFFIIQEGSIGTEVASTENVIVESTVPVPEQTIAEQHKNAVCDSFGKTIVTGSSRFPFEYLLRELTYAHGQNWDPFNLKQSHLALKDLNLFDHIHLYPYQGMVPLGDRPVQLKAMLDNPLEVRLHTGAGAQGTLRDLTFDGVTYKLGGMVLFKNPFNQADYFLLNADFTRPYRILEVQYWRPWLFNRPVRTLAQVYNNAFKYPSLRGLQRNLYQVTHQGLMLGLSRKWTNMEMGCNFGFEWMETNISNKLPQEGEFNRLVARAINFDPCLLQVKIPYLLLEPSLFINYLDDQLYPTQGFLTVLSAKGMFPLDRWGEDALFVKCIAEQSLFVPLPRIPVILALRLRLGYIIFQRFNNIMPSERFYLGGAFSLRSYQNDLCPPLGIVENGTAKPDYVPQGGKAMININLELRFPLYKQLNGVVFQDVGFLDGGSLRDLVHSDLLAGTGFGLRYNTPIGPIRFDMGFKWQKPVPDVSSLAWFLTLGQAF